MLSTLVSIPISSRLCVPCDCWVKDASFLCFASLHLSPLRSRSPPPPQHPTTHTRSFAFPLFVFFHFVICRAPCLCLAHSRTLAYLITAPRARQVSGLHLPRHVCHRLRHRRGLRARYSRGGRRHAHLARHAASLCRYHRRCCAGQCFVCTSHICLPLALIACYTLLSLSLSCLRDIPEEACASYLFGMYS